MPNTTIPLAADAWTLLTTADVTGNITFQVRNGAAFVAATVGATPPSVTPPYAAVLYPDSFGEANRTLAEAFPGATGATRLYGYASTPGAEVFVSF
jgi:hypothetical protein